MKILKQLKNSALTHVWRKSRSRYVSAQQPILIGGCPRSGTTLMRILLNAHPHLACGPESRLLAGGFHEERLADRFEIPVEKVRRLRQRAQDHAHFIELFLSHYAAQQGKTRWAEKSPSNVRHLAYLFRHFPQAKFVHVLRDGRDLVCSLRTHPRHHLIDGKPVATNICKPLRPCIQQWLRDTHAGMAWRGHPNYCEFRYEDLVQNPEPTLRKLCEFIGEPWDPILLTHEQQAQQTLDPKNFFSSANAVQSLSTSAIGRYRKDLTDSELQLFYRLAGPRLLELGYNRETS